VTGASDGQLKLLISENIYDFYIASGNPVKQNFNMAGFPIETNFIA
jgi:hypothetical protein